MNDSILGIIITFIVIGLVLSMGVAAHGGVELPFTGEVNIPQINAGTNTNTDAYWQYCYQLNIDNC